MASCHSLRNGSLSICVKWSFKPDVNVDHYHSHARIRSGIGSPSLRRISCRRSSSSAPASTANLRLAAMAAISDAGRSRQGSLSLRPIRQRLGNSQESTPLRSELCSFKSDHSVVSRSEPSGVMKHMMSLTTSLILARSLLRWCHSASMWTMSSTDKEGRARVQRKSHPIRVVRPTVSLVVSGRRLRQ